MPTAFRAWLAALTLVVATLVSTPAQAQSSSSWSFIPGAVLGPQPTLPWASQSVGAPSVAFDSIRNRFIMVFESRTPLTDPDCPQGIYALGLATSPNGFSWTVNSLPVLLPNPGNGSYFSCVAAHPAAVFIDDGVNGQLQVYFKGEQDTGACDTITPAWGCDQYTGVGRLRVSFNAAGNATGVNVQSTPVLELGGVGGYPRVIKDSGTYYLALQQYPDITMTQSASFNSFPTPGPIITVAAYAPVVTWVQDEFFNPSLVCDDSVAFPWAMFVGGRDTNFGTIVSGAMSKAIASNPALWALSTTTQVDWGTNNEWRHWDTQRLITGDYLVWFSEKDGSGNNFIRFGGTSLSFNIADVQGKICP